MSTLDKLSTCILVCKRSRAAFASSSVILCFATSFSNNLSGFERDVVSLCMIRNHEG